MSDDKSGQCEHGYYGLCPRCYDNLRADRDRYSDMLDISQGVVRELCARIAELERQLAIVAATRWQEGGE